MADERDEKLLALANSIIGLGADGYLKAISLLESANPGIFVICDENGIPNAESLAELIKINQDRVDIECRTEFARDLITNPTDTNKYSIKVLESSNPDFTLVRDVDGVPNVDSLAELLKIQGDRDNQKARVSAESD